MRKPLPKFLQRELLLLMFLLSTFPLYAEIPEAARNDSRYALGYLVVTYYPGVDSGGRTDSRAGLQQAIDDGFKNDLSVLFPEGTYLISDALTCYHWATWNKDKNRPNNPPRQHHVLMGSYLGDTRPVLKLTEDAAGFDDPDNPRPALVFNYFQAQNATASSKVMPSHPLGVPPNYSSLTANYFKQEVRNLDVDLSGHPGAVGIYFPAAQYSALKDVKISAGGALAGFYGLPGRNTASNNLEVEGGRYGIYHLAEAGACVSAVRLTGQTVACITSEDFVPLSVAGFQFSPASGCAVWIQQNNFSSSGGSMTLVDGSIEMKNAGPVIDNRAGRDLYLENVYMKGADTLAVSGDGAFLSETTGWTLFREYVYTSQDQPEGDPPYEKGDRYFRSFTLIDGIAERGSEKVVAEVADTPAGGLLDKHILNIPTFEGQHDGTAVVTSTGYGAVPDGETDCTGAIQRAIDESPGGRVFLPKGDYLITKPLQLHRQTILFGISHNYSILTSKDDWQGGSDHYVIETADDPYAVTYFGMIGFQNAAADDASVNAGEIHWRAGRNSTIYSTRAEKSYGTYYAKTPRNMFYFSGNGGGRHFLCGHYNYASTHTGSRLVKIEGTSEPLTLYGLNVEATKRMPEGTGNIDANIEITGSANVRIHNIKREGNAPTLLIKNSRNIAVYGVGRQNFSLNTNSGGYMQVQGASDHIVFACINLDNLKTTPNVPMLNETIDGFDPIQIDWPDCLSLYRRGQLMPMDSLPGKAWNPSLTQEGDGTLLHWEAGRQAEEHVIYFGPEGMMDKVGRQTDTLFHAGVLNDEILYHWRVDEMNDAGTTQGNVWILRGASFHTGSRPVSADPSLTIFPNPFSREASIRFHLKDAGYVTLQVVDLNGRVVRTLLAGVRPPGSYQFTWDGATHDAKRQPEGLYLIRYTTDHSAVCRKVFLL